MEKRLAITYQGEVDTKVYCGVSLLQKKIEAAGRGYQIWLTRRHKGELNEEESGDMKKNENEDSETGEGNDEGVEIDEEKLKEKRKRKKSFKLRENVNFYEVMGFDNWGEDFSLKLLKKNYMKLALKYHPDKLGDKYDEIAKKKWLKVNF